MRPILLFVDDDAGVLDGLRRQLRRRRDDWDMRFAHSAQEALAVFAAAAVGILVTDVRMPGGDGLALLREVRASHPGAERIVLSGYASPDQERDVFQAAHRVLPKPCEHAQLVETLEQAVAARALVPERGVRALVGGVEGLPAVPHIYTQLQAVLRDDMSDAQSVARIVERDAAMVASVLRGANSAALGLREPVTRVRDAVAYPGRRMVTNMVLGVATVERFREAGVSAAALRLFQARAMATANVAVRLVERKDRDDVYAGGMLHDIGQLAMLVSFGAPYEAVSNPEVHHVDDEAPFGASHDKVGAYLLGLWGLPTLVLEAVALHHAPLGESDHAVSRAVRIADCLIHASQEPKDAVVERLEAWPLTPSERTRAESWLADSRQPAGATTARPVPRPRAVTAQVSRPVTYRSVRRP